MKRRTFLQASAFTAAAAVTPFELRSHRQAPGAPSVETGWLQDAVQSAMDAGATYAEALFRRDRSETLQLRKEDITALESSEDAGIALRVFSGGAWGSAAVSSWKPGRPDALASAALASAAQLAKLRTQDFDPSVRETGGQHEWNTEMETDPFDVSIEERIAFLRGLTNKAVSVSQIPFAVANLFLRRGESELVTSRDAVIRQQRTFTYPNFAVTAFHQKLRRMDTRSSSMEARAAGWEVTRGAIDSDLETSMQEALKLQTADPVTRDSYDLVIHPTLLWDLLCDTLLPHLDPRTVLSLDGNRPGDQWISADNLGEIMIGSELLTLRADSSLPHGLASCGWDDTGRPSPSGTIVETGRIVRLPFDETLPRPAGLETVGFSRTGAWNIPVSAAMPNVVMEAGSGGTISDLVSTVDNGLLVKGRSRIMMNPSKTLFRVRPQMAWMIRGGAVSEVVRDVEIETSVEQFWKALDGLSTASESMTAGDLFPGRSSALWEVPFSVSVPAGVFRRIPVYRAQEAG